MCCWIRVSWRQNKIAAQLQRLSGRKRAIRPTRDCCPTSAQSYGWSSPPIAPRAATSTGACRTPAHYCSSTEFTGQTAINGGPTLRSQYFSDLYGSTPPEITILLPLTPPASDERHRPSVDASTDRVMRMLLTCHESTAVPYAIDRTQTNAGTILPPPRVA